MLHELLPRLLSCIHLCFVLFLHLVILFGLVADFTGDSIRVTTSWCRWKELTSLLDG